MTRFSNRGWLLVAIGSAALVAGCHKAPTGQVVATAPGRILRQIAVMMPERSSIVPAAGNQSNLKPPWAPATSPSPGKTTVGV